MVGCAFFKKALMIGMVERGSIESQFDRVEAFIEETLHKSNRLARSSFPNTKITNSYLHIPLYGVRLFSSKQRQIFEQQFPGAQLIQDNENQIYWIILKREE